MHILWVSQWFPPDLGALPARLTEMAQEWTGLGHDVTVVTAFPHHPSGVIPDSYAGKWVVEERFGAIHVIRCRLLALRNQKMWQRTLCQISFAVSAVLLGLRRCHRADVVIVSSPPFFTVPAGWLFARWFRVPLVFEVRDLWPAVWVEAGVMSRGFLYRFLERVEMACYRAARGIVVVTRSFREDLTSRGVPGNKIAVVPNGADLSFFSPGADGSAFRKELDAEGRFLVSYVGTQGLLQGLEQVLDAADALRGEPRFLFAFVGEGARREALEEETRRRGLTNVRFHPAVPKGRMPEVYAASDACVVCLRPLPIFAKFIPSKIFEVLACGRPLVAALEGEAAEIVRAAGGLVVPPGNGRAIAESLRSFAERPETGRELGTAGRRFVAENYDRANLARLYEEFLRAVEG
jgi:glycosyltransferase involved in cell wall biosynthesis